MADSLAHGGFGKDVFLSLLVLEKDPGPDSKQTNDNLLRRRKLRVSAYATYARKRGIVCARERVL
jgi:hypothetical protein